MRQRMRYAIKKRILRKRRLGNRPLDGHLHKPDTNFTYFANLRHKRHTNQNLQRQLQRRSVRSMGYLCYHNLHGNTTLF